MSVLCSMVGASFTVAAAAQVLRSKKAIYGNVTKPQIDTAQSKFGGASALYDGSGDYLVAGSTGDFLFPPDSDVTMELWFRIDTALTGEYNGLISIGSSRGSSSNEFFIYIETNSSTGSNRRLRLGHNFTNLVSSSTNLNLNQWYHVAATRSGTTFTLWLDGVSQGTSTNTLTLGQNTGGKIGALADGSLFFNKGHLDEIRISNTARYTANFTPATAAFVNDANTLFLMHANGTDATTFFEDDNGVRSSTSLIATGAAKVSTTQSKFGGSSANFDGSSNTQVLVRSWNTSSYTGDFTIEGWFYITDKTTSTNARIWSDGDGSTTEDFRLLQFEYSTNQIYMVTGQSGNDSWNYSYVSATLNINTWYHIAASRSGSSLRIFVNGTQQGSTISNSLAFTSASSNHSGRLGMFRTDASRYRGFIDDFRISNSARYTTTFTPSTTPFVNDSNTLLLIHGDGTNNSTVFRDDNGAVPFSTRTARTLTAQGNAQVDTAQFKYGSSALLCDGTGDYVVSPAGTQWEFGTSSFTIEYWIRFNAINTLYVPICSRTGGGNVAAGEWWCEITAAENKMYWGFKNQAGTQYYVNLALAGTAFATGQFYHIALVNNAGTAQMYINGTATGATTALSGSFGNNGTDLNISAYQGLYSVNGWMDEVRVSNTARYTANFTPTGPFNSDPNTMLLMHMEGTDASTTFTDDVFGVRTQKGIQAVGNAQVDTAQSKFGGASALFDGTGDYLDITPGNAFNTGDFTIEAWIYPTSVSGVKVIYDDRTSSSDASKILFYMNGTSIYYYATGNHITGSIPTANTWYHIAVSRSSGTVRMFIDGIQAGSNYTDSNSKTVNSNNDFLIGQNSESRSADQEFIGNIDEFRISNSARYTAAFTPSTTPFQNDTNTILLLHMDGTDGSTVFFDDNGIAPYTP